MRRVVAIVVLVLAACSTTSDDPGLDPGGTTDSSITSNTLGQCPPGGPDATTPAAGCLDSSGQVVRP